MGLDYFNYGLKPEYRADVALNYATGSTSTFRHSTIILIWYWVVVYSWRWMSPMMRVLWTRFVPAGTFIPVRNKLDVSLNALSGGEYQGKQIMSAKTVFRSTLPTIRS